MTNNRIVDSSFTAIINAPIDKIDVPEWCFDLSERDYQGCSPAHIAAGFTIAPDGKRMSINVGTIGGSLMVQHYVETLGQKDHLILDSISDVFTPNGRTTIHVTWELSVREVEAGKCEFTNRVRSHATDEFMAFIARQGIPFDQFRAQRQPPSIAHNQSETPLFAASIEALRSACDDQRFECCALEPLPEDTAMTRPTTCNKDTTALLFVDPYNDFLSEGGKIWPRIKEVALEIGLLDNLRAISRTVRNAGMKVFIAVLLQLISHVIVVGLLANTCIEPTSRYAMELGYYVTLVRDATAAFTREMMHAAHELNGPTYAHAIVKTSELVLVLR